MLRIITLVLFLFIPYELHSFGSFVNISQFNDYYDVKPRIYNLHRRHRRDINSNIYYESKLKIVQLGDWLLELDYIHNLFPKGKSEWITIDGVDYKSIKGCEFLSGAVHGFELSSSKAALTFCDNDVQIHGLFFTPNEMYVIAPSSSSSHAITPTTHRIYRTKRNVKQWEFFNLTGDMIDLGVEKEINDVEWESNEVRGGDNPPSEILDWKREQIDSEDVGYFYDTAWQPSFLMRRNNEKSFNNVRRWLEIAIAVDHTVIAFHGRQRVEQYVLTLMNIVNAIYQDPSLDANMHLVVTRLLLYENKRQSVVRPGNAKKSLENVNIWNRGLHISLAPGETHHDIAIWLTRSDIGGPSGYAPVSGACDPERSCALNRDEGLTSAFIIAHEMAHILGLSHDGDKKMYNDCGDQAFDGSVMAPMVSATFNQFIWSDCSRKEFANKASKWKCLLNSPAGFAGEITLNSTLQTSFSMDEQCRMEFGDGYQLCRSFDIVEPCSHLWCGKNGSPLVCKTKKGPPLEGTECGFDKWCVNGYCEMIDRQKFNINPVQFNPQNGGWSEWSPWGPCSRSCGTGVEFRVRKCDNPPPVYGGSDCFGLKEEWRICNMHPCPEPLKDIRAQQCRRLSKLLKLKPPRASMTWLPFESSEYELKCKLICTSKETKEFYITEENLIDGTPCSYENKNNICIQGVCQLLGCDGKLFSTKHEDACGVCGGDNSQCTKIQTILKRRLKRTVNRVAIFPRQSHEIKVEVNFTNRQANIALMLKDRKRDVLSMSIPNAGSQIIQGTKFYYKIVNDTHILWAKGPILSELILLIHTGNNLSELNVTGVVEYYVHKKLLDENAKYKWIIGGWGPCSKTCGGGRRFKTKACWDNPNNKIVPRKFCSLITKPNVTSEKCNTFSCSFVWVSGNWEPCSKTCGSHGVQAREVYCLPQSALYQNDTDMNEPWKFMVSPDKCGGIKPSTTRSCSRTPCPSYWKFEDWSPCSTSCGLGVATREAYCVRPNDNETFYCEQLPTKQTTYCKEAPSRSCRKPKPCLKDFSIYCGLSLMHRYCKINKFRKLCCQSCNDNRITPIME